MRRFWIASTLGMFSAAALAQQSPMINEFVFDHVGTDANEFVEIWGPSNFNLANFQLIGIEGDGSVAGVVDNNVQPGTTDANGFWTTSFGSNVWENGTLTLLLVTGFSGSVGLDLDTNNDGILDSTPWSGITDGVAVSDNVAGDFAYTSVVLNPDFDGGVFRVGGASRIPNGTDTNSTADWMRNDFDGAGFVGFTGTPVTGEAYNTPGTFNQPVPEPATLAALGMGALALIRRRRK